MEPAIKDVLKQYAVRAEQQRIQIEKGEELKIDELLLWVGPETGALLNALVKAKHDDARKSLGAAGLLDHVDLRTGNALEIIPTVPDGIDFVLVDLWKNLYVPCLELFFPKLKPGAVIVADNMLRPKQSRPDALAYRRAVRAMPGITSVLLPVGSGLEISRLAGPHDEGL